MRNFLIILAITLFSCSNKEKSIYTLPNSQDINEIVKTIIISDSIPVFIKSDSIDTVHYSDRPDLIRFPIKFPLSLDLEKLVVCFPQFDEDGNMPPPPPHGIGVTFNSILEYSRLENSTYFTQADSGYFCFQNDTLKHFIFDDSIIKKIHTTTKIKQKNKEDTFFSCSLPIFSLDKKTAYVELTYNCYGLCSYANAYILKKVNGAWVVIKKQNLWFS